ncbi:hypothetical protein [Nonomuraea dietziae]|uniref:hypothetical protein n=1 Tax=Nonomuraea dietziae TaxID=65515 RepID=UPI0031D4FEC0
MRRGSPATGTHLQGWAADFCQWSRRIGHALLAQLTDDEVAALLPDPLPASHEQSITDLTKFTDELDRCAPEATRSSASRATPGVACVPWRGLPHPRHRRHQLLDARGAASGRDRADRRGRHQAYPQFAATLRREGIR